jgi:hypothetical protein
MPSIGVLYFGLFDPFKYSTLPLYLPPPIFKYTSLYPLLLCLMVYDINDIIIFFSFLWVL